MQGDLGLGIRWTSRYSRDRDMVARARKVARWLLEITSRRYHMNASKKVYSGISGKKLN
jgi:hypothetical protein